MAAPPTTRNDDRNGLVLDHLWLARRYARRFERRGEPLDDLVQVAMLGLVQAAERFDPDRGIDFVHFASPTVLGVLRRHFRDHTWQLAVPRSTKDLAAALGPAVDELTQRSGRSPTPRELAAHLQRPVEEVLEALSAREVTRPRALDAAELSGESDADLVATADRLTVQQAAGALDERRRRVVLWRFYEGCTQAEIGRRLGVGQVQVSRLLRSAIDELRGALTTSGPLSPT